MDLEMTGLDVSRDCILEVAVVVTNSSLQPIGPSNSTYGGQESDDFLHLIIHRPPKVLEGMNEWCIEHHGASGLTKKVSLAVIDPLHSTLHVLTV